jgi:hypothetical protein
MFEQSQHWFRDEADFWQARLTKAAEQAVADGEKLAGAVREGAEKALQVQQEMGVEAFRRGLALAGRQLDAWRAAFDPNS